MSAPQSPKRRDPLFLSLAINVVCPSLVLSRLSGPESLGPVTALGVALAFPVCFQLWDLLARRTFSWIALFGLLNVLSTGVLTLYASDHIWFAVKETSFPLLVGLFVVASSWTDQPFVGRVLLRPEIFDLNKLEAALEGESRRTAFQKALVQSNALFSLSFGLSAVLNYVLAVRILKSPVGTPAFNAELGEMTALSFPVITLPATLMVALSMFYFFRRISTLTGRPISDLMASAK